MGMVKLPRTHSYCRRREKVTTVSEASTEPECYPETSRVSRLVRIDLATLEILPSDQDRVIRGLRLTHRARLPDSKQKERP